MPRRHLLLLIAAVVLVRLPFLAEAIQGDDVYYLLFARNALVDPLHPMQMGFRLQGETVWAAGHTRPPGNAYVLAGLLALFGEVRETAFHAAYILFSLIAVLAAYRLAQRFTDRPLWAALLTLAAPAFLVNGNKLESDLPLMAFWTLGFAWFVWGRHRLAAGAMAVTAFFGYQAMFAVPILAHWAWFRDRRKAWAWAAVFAAPLALVGWQLWERATVGAAPAAVLAGYFQTYDLLALERKGRSTLALIGHLGLVVSPLLVAVCFLRRSRVAIVVGPIFGAVAAFALGYDAVERILYIVCAAMAAAILFEALRVIWSDHSSDEGFLGVWVGVFFLAAVAVFYAGSARYLLPLTPALAVWAVRRGGGPILVAVALVSHVALGLALAKAEYDYADTYREIAQETAAASGAGRIWTNAEWGLRYYLGEAGGEALLAEMSLPAGSTVAMSSLAASVPYESAGIRTEIARREIRTGVVPLRTMGAGSNTGYSSSQFGALPFGLGAGVIDTVTLYSIGAPEPTLSYLKMDDPAADEHILGGIYPSEGEAWRWTSEALSAVLLVPPDASEVEVDLYVPENLPERRVQVFVDGRVIADETYAESGGYKLRARAPEQLGATGRIMIRVDEAYSPPGDERSLGVVMLGFGFRGPEAR